MFDLFHTWWIWLGGGFIALVVVMAGLYLSGAKVVVETFDKAIEPVLVALGKIGGDVISDVWSEYRQGLKEISKTVAAMVTLVVTCGAVALFVYFPTKHVAAKQAEARTWKYAHAHWRMTPRPKPKTVAQSLSDTVHKSLGGL